MAPSNKVTIVLGAALKTPQSVSFEDATAFTFGTISEVVQFVPANAGFPTGGSPTTTKLTTRGKRPNVIIPNPPKVWRKKESPADKKPEATTPSTGGRINPFIFGRKDSMTVGGRMLASPRLVQERTTAFTPFMKKEEESAILVGDSAPVTRIFSNPEKARKRERQQERKKRARQNKGQRPKPRRQAGPTKSTLADNNLFNLLRLIKKNSYTTIGLKLRISPDYRANSCAPKLKVRKKNVLKNAYDTYKAAKKNKASQKALTTKMGTGRSQFPLCMPRRRMKENYEIHTVRVIEESDPPPTHEAAPVRDRIVTRSQSSRMTSTPRKDSLSIAAEESTSTPRNLPPATEEESKDPLKPKIYWRQPETIQTSCFSLS